MQQTQRHTLAAAGDGVLPLRVLMPSPIGPLGLELRGPAITRVVVDPAGEELAGFESLHALSGSAQSDRLDEVCGRLSEYFSGARRRLDVEFDLTPSGATGFARRVLKETAKIPYGRTRTCQEIAESCGRPEAHPQVLAVLLANPIPVIVACHRVLAADGAPGEWVGGAKRKRWLLHLEQSAGSSDS